MSLAEHKAIVVPAPAKRDIRSFLGAPFKSPALEIYIMAMVLIVSYIAMGLISKGIETPAEGMSAGVIFGLLFGCFLRNFRRFFIAEMIFCSRTLSLVISIAPLPCRLFAYTLTLFCAGIEFAQCSFSHRRSS